MKTFVAFIAVCILPSAAFACGGYGPLPDAQAALLQLKQLDLQTTAVIFCELADGSELDVLETEKSTATDEQVEYLKLDLLSSEKVDEMLDQAMKLPKLKSITVNFCWGGAGTLTKSQVEKLAACEHLVELKLVKTSISAENFAAINGSKTLEKLWLDQKCTVPVEELKIESLRKIGSDQDFSSTEREAMEANLPNCRWIDPSRPAQGG